MGIPFEVRTLSRWASTNLVAHGLCFTKRQQPGTGSLSKTSMVQAACPNCTCSTISGQTTANVSFTCMYRALLESNQIIHSSPLCSEGGTCWMLTVAPFLQRTSSFSFLPGGGPPLKKQTIGTGVKVAHVSTATFFFQ